MSIKTLFDKQKENNNPVKSLFQKTTQELFEDVESSDYVNQYQNSVNLYLQDVNFATASNFARFGSARKYYENITNRITGYFPYDGSRAEQLEFENNLNPFEKYIYLYEYPRSTGYVSFAPNGWGGRTSVNSIGVGLPNNLEYISFYNQNNDNIYDPNNGLMENTRFIFSSGSTIEFWMKKNQFADFNNETKFEAIFYMASTGSDNKEKMFSIYLYTDSGYESKIYSAYHSRQSTADIEFSFEYETGLTSIADSEWHHYAMTFYSSSDGYASELYVDGIYKTTQTQALTTTFVNFTGSSFCTIGSVGGNFLSSVSPIGSAKLSGSIDEFRFWNTKRNAKQIGLNYFTNVGGGNNSYQNNNIGIYFKFNEGITGDSETDSVILDYAGRNCNGLFTGYSSNSRNIGSAITDTQDKPEIGVPILYSIHPDVQSYLDDRLYYADEHDYKNNFMLKNSMPAWILDDDSNNGDTLVNFLQTLASYLDTLYLQISTSKLLKNKDYLNYEGKAPPFSELLLTSNGFDLPSLFLNTDVIQSLLNQDSKKEYNESINNLKNIIYKNIYNNINIIYKSKGTENSIKQLIKNFGVNQDVFSLNIYANNAEYQLDDNYVNKSIKKDYIDFTPFSSSINSSAVIYQLNTDANTSPFITGSTSAQTSFTAECNVVIPSFPQNYDYLAYKTLTWNTSSVFGIRTAGPGIVGLNGITYNTIVPSGDSAGLKVRFIYRDDKGYFQLSYPSASITLTSPIFPDILTNQHWNLSVRFSPIGTGSSYNLEFAGYSNFVLDNFRSFSVSSSIASNTGSVLLSTSKRLYVGAERDDVTGSLVYNSLTKCLSAKYWVDYLTSEELKEHAKNPNNYGRLDPYQPYLLSTSSYTPNSETLLLHWDFSNVTSSNSNGNITKIYDLTNGSIYGNSYSNQPVDNVIGRRYDGKGYGFAPSSNVKGYELVYASEQQSPENLYSSQLIEILSTDDDNYSSVIKPQKYFFSIENSMYDTISKNMLNMFASIIEFNNFIGEPGNLYKTQYSKLKFFRKIFFDKSSNSPDLDKYIGIYKWIDDALDNILFNLIPASANANDKIRTMVENHVLERNKAQLHLLPDTSTKIIGAENTNVGAANGALPPPGFSFSFGPPPGKKTLFSTYGKERGFAESDNLKVKYTDVDGTIPAEGSYVTRYELPSSLVDLFNFNRRVRSQNRTVASRVGRTR